MRATWHAVWKARFPMFVRVAPIVVALALAQTANAQAPGATGSSTTPTSWSSQEIAHYTDELARTAKLQAGLHRCDLVQQYAELVEDRNPEYYRSVFIA